MLILPGSRTQEIVHNLPWFLAAAERIRQATPGVRFAVGALREKHGEMSRAIVERHERGKKEEGRGGEVDQEALTPGTAEGGCSRRERGPAPPTLSRRERGPLPLEIHVGKTPELMHSAACAMACSGSVSLELLHYAVPTVILYWISRPAYFVQGLFRKSKYITLVNLLADHLNIARDGFHIARDGFHIGGMAFISRGMAFISRGMAFISRGMAFISRDGERGVGKARDGRESESAANENAVLFPEHLTWEDRSAEIAAQVIEWLSDEEKRRARVAALERLREKVGQPGAAARAATYILDGIGEEKKGLGIGD